MGKKRKASRQSGAASGPRDVDPADARLNVRSYEDIADSEEEYFANQDKILLEDGPLAKRHKAAKEDEMFDSSDEEVLGYDDDASDGDDDHDPGQSRGDQGEYEDEGDDRGYWGSSKKEYYEADAPETEADALAEEAEAKRLQQKKLARMSEEDFVFDADEWAARDTAAEEDGQGRPPAADGALTEVLEEVDVTSDMGPEEVYRVLQARYPEFDFLVDEFRQLQPRLPEYRQAAEGKPPKSVEVVQYWTLGCYIAALASYLAILTSPARDGEGRPKTLDPSTLRGHEVMQTLVSCRQAWYRTRELKPPVSIADTHRVMPSHAEDPRTTTQADNVTAKAIARADRDSGHSDRSKRPKKQLLAKAKKLEDSLADLSELLSKPNLRKEAQPQHTGSAQTVEGDDNSDFGDEEVLDAHTAQDKVARRKSLRFYTSQIVQKAGRRAGAGRDAGGDVDIPRRERLRDRQARLNAEAERRGQKCSKHGEDLGGDDGDDDAADAAVGNGLCSDEDEYYDMVTRGSKQNKAEKAARQEALKTAGRNDRVVEREELGEDGKRQVTYHILKNKGLAPKRKKDAKNPRVKKRKKFEEKQKKLKSIRAVYGGGEGRGGYQGELSGIKTGLVKSVKLS